MKGCFLLQYVLGCTALSSSILFVKENIFIKMWYTCSTNGGVILRGVILRGVILRGVILRASGVLSSGVLSSGVLVGLWETPGS